MANGFPFSIFSPLFSGYASFLACFVTYYFIPETSGLDLLEIDIQWRMTLEGKKRDYHGPAINPNFLSVYERRKMGFGTETAEYAAWNG
jgi:hypothetical protein